MNSSNSNSNISNSLSSHDSGYYIVSSKYSSTSFSTFYSIETKRTWAIFTFQSSKGIFRNSNIMNCFQKSNDNGIVYSFSGSYLTLNSCILLNNGENSRLFAVTYATMEIIHCIGEKTFKNYQGTIITSNMQTNSFDNILTEYICPLFIPCFDTEDIPYFNIQYEIIFSIFIIVFC